MIFPDLPGFTVLRLFRAFRVFRLFKRIPSLQAIIVGQPHPYCHTKGYGKRMGSLCLDTQLQEPEGPFRSSRSVGTFAFDLSFPKMVCFLDDSLLGRRRVTESKWAIQLVWPI